MTAARTHGPRSYESSVEDVGPRGFQLADPIRVPPIYNWPPRPIAAARWLVTGLLWPWGVAYIALAVVAWSFLTPDREVMSVLAPGWIALIWLRNAVLLTLLAGGLHWWLYIRRAQGQSTKYDERWPATDDPRFLWRNQVRDNMFWSLASGCTIWSLWEALTLWLHASGRIPTATWSEAPVYLSLMLIATFFWSALHFYCVHRLLHWRPIYRVAHELHHRNVNTGPWTGIAMHPLEHLVYFSLFALWWVVPADPVVILVTGFFTGLSPAVSHSNFDRLKIGARWSLPAGIRFHDLHHRYYETNYGNTFTPVDKLFGTWHDGTPQAHAAFKRRRLAELATR